MNRQKVINHINEANKEDSLLLYIDDIFRDIVWHNSGMDFRLPSGNSCWSMDVMRVIIHLCSKYPYNYFILGKDSSNEVAGYISIYVQGIE